MQIVNTRAVLAALPTFGNGQSVFLSEAGRAGEFVWTVGDLSSQVSADPSQGLWVAGASDPTGRSGAWGRVFDASPNGSSVLWWGAVGDGITDDTAAMNAAVVAVSASASSGERKTLSWPDGKYLTDGLLAKPNVFFNFGNARLIKRVDGSSSATNSLFRCVPVETAGSLYGSYGNIKVRGGVFDSNNKTCPAHTVSMIWTEDLDWADSTAIHTALNPHWAYQWGGRRGSSLNAGVEGGTLTFQDGHHLYHGQDWTIAPAYTESGDDCVALGGEPTDATLAAHPDPIRRVVVLPFVGRSAKASIVKIYVNTSAPDTSDWEVTDVNVVAAIGTNLEDVGVAIHDYNTPSTPRIRNITVQADVNIGSNALNAASAQAIWVHGTKNVTAIITARDAVSAITAGTKLAAIESSDNTDLTIQSNFVKTIGIYADTNTRLTLRPTLQGDAIMSSNMIQLRDTNCRMVLPVLWDAPNGQDIVSFTAAHLSELTVEGGSLAHVVGATTGYAFNPTSVSCDYFVVDGCDVRSTAQKFNGSNVVAIASYRVANCPGAPTKKRGIVTVPSASTSVSAAHGSALPTVSTAQFTLLPRADIGTAAKFWLTSADSTHFTTNLNVAPGADTDFAWTVDSSTNMV